MNTLIVGAEKSRILESFDFSSSFLMIDDGELIDALAVPPRRKVVRFDVGKHRFNPLQGMDYRRAREFVSVLDAVFPEGDNTLTKKNANFALLTALLDEPSYLHKLLRPDKDPAKQDAYQKIQTLLLSPVLSTVLCKARNFSMNGIVLARLDRAVLGDFVCQVLAWLLISQSREQVVITDGSYLRDHHIALIRQGRLTVQVSTLARVPPLLRQELLTIENKRGVRANYDDAVTLANYAGLRPDPTRQDNPYNRFIDEAME